MTRLRSLTVGPDILLAVGLFAGAVVSTLLGEVAGMSRIDDSMHGWAMLFAALLTLPLLVRRSAPILVCFVMAGSYILGGSIGAVELYVSQVSMFVAFYTVGARVEDRRRATLARVIVMLAMFLWLLVSTLLGAADPTQLSDTFGSDVPPGAMSPYVAFMMLNWLINIAYFGGAYLMGDRAWTAERNRRLLQERTHELEAEIEINAAQAIALDRVRIARELHDVVAHHVSAMGVHAGAARTIVDRDADAAKGALEIVEESSRSALVEMRHLLSALRSGDGAADIASDAPSTVRLDALAGLAERVAASGTPTTFRVIGDPVEVPDVAQVNLYRIAQEALTNARRHGGPDVTCDMRLRYQPGSVELEVTNTGRLALSSRPGLGQLGMRERATASGGTIELAPRDSGGYLVRVTIPLSEEDQA